MTPTDWIIALATAVIAFYSVALWRAAKLSAQREKEFRGQLSDLYQAIVIGTILGGRGPSAMREAVQEFTRHYKGKTPIFEE